MARDRVQMLVMGGENRDNVVPGPLGEGGEGLEETLFVGHRIRCERALGVARAVPERPGAVVDREDAHAAAAERANGCEPVHPADLGHDGSSTAGRHAAGVYVRVEERRVPTTSC